MSLRCETCAWWQKEPGRQFGECHADLPKPDKDGYGKWPRVFASAFCRYHTNAASYLVEDESSEV